MGEDSGCPMANRQGIPRQRPATFGGTRVIYFLVYWLIASSYMIAEVGFTVFPGGWEFLTWVGVMLASPTAAPLLAVAKICGKLSKWQAMTAKQPKSTQAYPPRTGSE